MKKLSSFLLFSLLAVSAWTQGPNNSGTYYQAADGKKGAALKKALNSIIYHRTERSYGDLWTDFRTTDVRPDGKVWDMYSNITNFTLAQTKIVVVAEVQKVNIIIASTHFPIAGLGVRCSQCIQTCITCILLISWLIIGAATILLARPMVKAISRLVGLAN